MWNRNPKRSKWHLYSLMIPWMVTGSGCSDSTGTTGSDAPALASTSRGTDGTSGDRPEESVDVDSGNQATTTTASADGGSSGSGSESTSSGSGDVSTGEETEADHSDLEAMCPDVAALAASITEQNSNAFSSSIYEVGLIWDLRDDPVDMLTILLDGPIVIGEPVELGLSACQAAGAPNCYLIGLDGQLEPGGMISFDYHLRASKGALTVHDTGADSGRFVATLSPSTWVYDGVAEAPPEVCVLEFPEIAIDLPIGPA